jgi:hypothetical protein
VTNPVVASRAVANKAAANKAVAKKAVAAVARKLAAAPEAAVANLKMTWASLNDSPLLPLFIQIQIRIGDKGKIQMDAFTLLKTDHEKVAGILETIENTTERALKGRDELFA